MRTTALLLTLACLAGCGPMPNAPVLDDSAARVQANGVGTQAMVVPIDPADTPGGPTVTPPPSALPAAFGGSALIEQTQTLSDNLGGTVRNGRWQVVVPRGAVTATASFSIATPTVRSGVCDLGIAPAELNHFTVPVTLVADCHNVAPKRLASWFISWFDPATGTWVRVPGSVVDLKKKTVSAPLAHFSIYCVGPEAGKSGW
jgi:hypothetical protein